MNADAGERADRRPESEMWSAKEGLRRIFEEEEGEVEVEGREVGNRRAMGGESRVSGGEGGGDELLARTVRRTPARTLHVDWEDYGEESRRRGFSAVDNAQ